MAALRLHRCLPPAVDGRPTLSWRSPTVVVLLGANLASATLFWVVAPKVGDMWAALARQEAAQAGVGIAYWFGWYSGGTAPGSYSVLTPMLSVALGARALAGLATLGLVVLAHLAVRGTPRPAIALWAATVAASANLWSGRVPFAIGGVAGLVAVVAIRADRRYAAVLAGIVTVLFSPVSGAFLVLGAGCAGLTTARHRIVSLTCAAATGLTLLVVAIWFGAPGPQGFTAGAAAASVGLLAVLLLARPSRVVTLVVVITSVAIPLLIAVPNAMGSNVLRLVYTALPVAVAATSRARRIVVAIAVIPALLYGVGATARDLTIAAAPNSQPAYYDGVKAELGRLSAPLSNHRLEVVSDGTHAGAYALLGVAALARGYETQADNTLDAVLDSPHTLTPSVYRTWLSSNAVGIIAVDRAPLHRTAEYDVITDHRPDYLRPVWSSKDWVLHGVVRATPIVAPPASFVSADQAHLTLHVSARLFITLRLRWSHLLTSTSPPGAPPADLDPAPGGWTHFSATSASDYTLRGR